MYIVEERWRNVQIISFDNMKRVVSQWIIRYRMDKKLFYSCCQKRLFVRLPLFFMCIKRVDLRNSKAPLATYGGKVCCR